MGLQPEIHIARAAFVIADLINNNFISDINENITSMDKVILATISDATGPDMLPLSPIKPIGWTWRIKIAIFSDDDDNIPTAQQTTVA
jgi:hypothetical protein